MVISIEEEGFFYQENAAVIVDSIIELFESGIKSFESYDQWQYDVPISSLEESYTHFNWYFEVSRAVVSDITFEYSFFGLAGRDYFDEPSITITIVIPKGKHQKKIKIDRAELFDVVAHELHHLAQNMENNSYDRSLKHTGENASLSYLLDPYEIEAFHIGIRAQSQLSGKSFELIASSYIKEAWKETTQEHIDLIINAWKTTSFPVFKQNQS